MISINAVGGGAKGILTCGVLKRLHEINYVYDMLCGTSSGAPSVTLFAQGDIDVLEHMWLTIQNSDVRSGASLINVIKHKSFYDNSPLLKTLQKYVKPEKIKTPTYVTVTNTSTNAPERYRVDLAQTSEAASQIIWASMSVPILFPRVRINDKSGDVYYDGGCMDDYNVRAAIDRGATKVIVIHPSRPSPANINSIIDAVEWQLQGPMWGQYINELTGLGDSENPVKVIPIIPALPLGLSLLDFSYKGRDRKALIQLGYNLCKEVIG